MPTSSIERKTIVDKYKDTQGLQNRYSESMPLPVMRTLIVQFPRAVHQYDSLPGLSSCPRERRLIKSKRIPSATAFFAVANSAPTIIGVTPQILDTAA
ncbi:uncharacterized protein RAG0_06282 [Rhynchosporium agropyri]|uniref:Uncharacterized protein n=1 Tax=Rhynchosporium agropyri TaxID=914238 RepID=A0A1E1KGF7_9HELO|nr:uncharacterized protein RAG0_06282 [Rhynchosporium agropyri]